MRDEPSNVVGDDRGADRRARPGDLASSVAVVASVRSASLEPLVGLGQRGSTRAGSGSAPSPTRSRTTLTMSRSGSSGSSRGRWPGTRSTCSCAVAHHLPQRRPQQLAQQVVLDAVEAAAHVVDRARIERDLGVGVVAVVREDEIRLGAGRRASAMCVSRSVDRGGDRRRSRQPAADRPCRSRSRARAGAASGTAPEAVWSSAERLDLAVRWPASAPKAC